MTIRPRLNVICGRCGKRREGLRHVCRSNSTRRATIKLQPVLGGCARCGKQYGGRNGNPLTHVCRPRDGDFRKRKTARKRKAQAAARAAARAAERDKQRAKIAAVRDRERSPVQGAGRPAEGLLRGAPGRREGQGRAAAQEPGAAEAAAAAAAARVPVLRRQGLPAAGVRRVQGGLPGRPPRRLPAGIRAGLAAGLRQGIRGRLRGRVLGRAGIVPGPARRMRRNTR